MTERTGIIVGAAPDIDEPGLSIQCPRRQIVFAHFKKDLGCTAPKGIITGSIDQQCPDTPPAVLRPNCDQQHFHFGTGGPAQRKTSGGAVLIVKRLAGKAAGLFQRAGELQCRPGFTKGYIETGPHDIHQRVEMTSVSKDNHWPGECTQENILMRKIP